jgi:hypothetical protein
MFSISLISFFFMRATRMSKMAKKPTNMDNEIIGKISIFSIVCHVVFDELQHSNLCIYSACGWFNFLPSALISVPKSLQVSNHRYNILLSQRFNLSLWKDFFGHVLGNVLSDCISLRL